MINPEFQERRNKVEHLLPKPREMDFNAPTLAATWKKWKQNMEFYLTAMMKGKTEEEKYSVFLFLISEKEEMCSTQSSGRRK